MNPQFDNALMTVSMTEILGIWGDLVEAFHHVAIFGETAEIYAYRLMPYSPTAHTHRNKRMADEIATQAAHALCALVEQFCRKYECEAEIDNMPLAQWRRAHTYAGGSCFDHRCYVRIIRKDRPRGSQ
jgi:hypothetical protein